MIVLKSDPLILSFYEQALVEENYSFILTNRLLYEELLEELVLLSPALIDRIIPKKKDIYSHDPFFSRTESLFLI